jgi:hypothetical protein
MMNKIKKASILFVVLLTLTLYSSIGALAEEWGNIQIDDAVGGVGGELYVNINMTSGGSPIGDTALSITFDPYVLEFVRGTNASAQYGTVTVMAAGDGEVTYLDYYVVFRGVAEGESALTLVSYITWLHDGAVLMAEFNSATVTIGPEGTEGTGLGGEGAVDTPFEGAPTGDSDIFPIQGADFTIFDHFSEAMVPTGFVRDQFDIRGSLHNGMRHIASNRVFMYMVTGNNDPILALLEEDAVVFRAAEIRDKGGDRFVIVIDNPGVAIPDGFHSTELEFAGTRFPAWQSEEHPEFSLVYAISSAGQEGLYMFDAVDGTFQRFMGPIVEVGDENDEEADEATGVVGRIISIIQDNVVIVLAAILIIVFLLLIIIIVLSVKVQRRNNELDELYAEGQGSYGRSDDSYDDFDDEDDNYEDDYEYEDDRYHDDGYDDYEDDDGYDEVGYEEDDYETEVTYDDDDYEDDYDDYEDDEEDEDDEFNIDFVDL